MPCDGARQHRRAHQCEPDQHPYRLRVDERGGDRPHADAVEGEQRAARGARQRGNGDDPAGDPEAAVAARHRLERGQPARGRARPAVGRQGADAQRRALGGTGRRRHLARVLVRRHDALGHARPGVALGAAGGRGPEGGAPLRVEREVAEGLGQPRGVAAREEDAVAAVAHHVAIAGDVRRHDRAAGRERLGEDHPERLAAQRRRAQQVGVDEGRVTSVVVHAPERRDAVDVLHERGDLLGGRADDRELGGHLGAQRLEGAQEHGQALALHRLADEGDAQRVGRRARGAAGGTPPGGSVTPLGTIR